MGEEGMEMGTAPPSKDHHEPSRQLAPSAAGRWEMLHTPQPPCRGWPWFREPESNKLLRDGGAGSRPPSRDRTERTPARGMSLPSLPAPVPWAPKMISWVSEGRELESRAQGLPSPSNFLGDPDPSASPM